MTRRDRLEAKLQKRQTWAESAERRAAQRFDAAHKLADQIPLGQPILVGTHSERHQRRDADRIQSNMEAGLAERHKAQDHASAAAGLADQLDRNIYSDDPDALEALQARIADLETKQAREKAINAAYRKRDNAALLALSAPGLEWWDEALKGAYSWARKPYELSRGAANIRRLRERLADVQRQQARGVAAEAAGGVVIEDRGDYCRVTFAEKPAQPVLEALRTAGFRWGGGSWQGLRAGLPAGLRGEMN